MGPGLVFSCSTLSALRADALCFQFEHRQVIFTMSRFLKCIEWLVCPIKLPDHCDIFMLCHRAIAKQSHLKCHPYYILSSSELVWQRFSAKTVEMLSDESTRNHL
ncbi:hypothetical protein ATANTOWER_026342 [Ataeniobius toweri]|uniref:Secreted protein n=1 Tax=Ataeniobius toweri TaxID=208326 RepID=A0ABU7AJ65_9TELE|nr:hypothetical protein [Ataeniobius toweri]